MLHLVETQSVCSHAVLLHGKRAGGIVSLSLMAENEDACVSPRRAGFSRHPDLAFQMSEYSPRLFVACKQGSCTVFVNVSAASRRVESVKLLVPLGGWAGVQGHYPFQIKWRSHGRWTSWTRFDEREERCWLSDVRDQRLRREKKEHVRMESYFPGTRHGEVEGVRPRQMRSHNFPLMLWIVLFFFSYCSFNHRGTP